jgi:hypothetical protein
MLHVYNAKSYTDEAAFVGKHPNNGRHCGSDCKKKRKPPGAEDEVTIATIVA